MLNNIRKLQASSTTWNGLIVKIFCFFLVCCSSEVWAYQGFGLLKESDCKSIAHSNVPKLPVEWQKYSDFVKVCELKERKEEVATVFVVSIWVSEYYRTCFPGRNPVWEEFPLPLILDAKFRKIGELPEIYPSNDITSPDVYYGRWKRGIPTEIRIDVNNPAVDGDYYYPPLHWEPQKGLYMMSGKEVKYGKRH